MSTRRDFLKRAGSAAGIVFCSCEMLAAAGPQAPQSQRLPVMVNGKRIKTIDVHAHCHFHEAVALMGDEASRVLPRTKGAKEHFIVIEERLKGMDSQAIDMEVLSINPFWYRMDRDTAAKIVEVQNEKLADLCASHPERFAAFASLSLQYPDLAVQQLETAVTKLGLRGAAIGGSVLGEDFSEPNSIRSGQRQKSSTRFCSSIHKAHRNWRGGSKAMAGCQIRWAIHSTRRWHCNT